MSQGIRSRCSCECVCLCQLNKNTTHNKNTSVSIMSPTSSHQCNECSTPTFSKALVTLHPPPLCSHLKLLTVEFSAVQTPTPPLLRPPPSLLCPRPARRLVVVSPLPFLPTSHHFVFGGHRGFDFSVSRQFQR